MKEQDKRLYWKKKNNLELMMIIQHFIDNHQITSVRDYQKKLKEYPKQAPSLWFITERFGSWKKLLVQLGKQTYDRYRWDKLTTNELYDLIESFIISEKIRSQREYERIAPKKNYPCIATLKKRLRDIKPLFSKPTKSDGKYSDFELLFKLRTEIIRLNMEENLSMVEFINVYDREKLPTMQTIMNRTGKNWEELMEEIGFDYQSIKKEKLLRNFK